MTDRLSQASQRIRDVRAVIVNATPSTNWTFVQVDTDAGLTGIGEATLGGHEDLVLACLAMLKPALIGQPAGQIERLCAPASTARGGLAYAAALSGVEQALWDLLGQELGVPTYRLLGGAVRDAVRVYANINRGTRGDRSPAAFARSAEAAVRAGFTAIKCAPFDGVLFHRLEDRDGRDLIRLGVERVRAIRSTVGPNVDVLVDCHFRFDARTGARVVNELAAEDLFWIEAPVSEQDLEGWAVIRSASRARLAGAEMLIGLEPHRRFLDATGVDVLMPDVKYAGGIGALKKVAALAEARGAHIAPHNPSGPVGTLASLHAAISMPNALILEWAWGEVDWRSDLVGGAECFEDGQLVLPAGAGLGVSLDQHLVAAHPRAAITPWVDVRLG